MFQNFLDDMGVRPEGRTIDRIDANGNYTPENCRWADAHIQAINQKIQKNNVTSIKGVSREKSGKFHVEVGVRGKLWFLGRFKTIDEAAAARKAGEVLHGYGIQNFLGAK